MRFISAALIVTSALTLFDPARGAVPVICDGDQEPDRITRMNLTDSEVTTNTLHLPDGELRYKDVGKNRGTALDLKITVNTEAQEYEYTNIKQAWEDRNANKPSKAKDIPDGYNGKKEGSAFGILNLQTLKNKPKSGEGSFEVCLVKSDTDELIKNNFTFTIFDFDERGEDDKTNSNAMLISIKEKVLIDLGRESSYKLSNDTEINVACEDDPYTVDANGRCPDGVRTVFLSSTPGIGEDNPETVYGLTPKQKNRAVAIQFVDTDCFNITFDHYCPCEQAESVLEYDIPENRNLKCKHGKCRGYSGGNLLFAGDAPEVTETYPCITKSPTMSPTLPPTTCDDDKGPQVFLEHEIGGYNASFDLIDAIEVLSQNTETVTVALWNVWPSENGAEQSIFYQYRNTTVNEKCGKAENVTVGQKYQEITISCLCLENYAKFDIYVVDKSRGVTNETEIPVCCDGTGNSLYPTVKYTFAVNCECYLYEKPTQTIS